MALNMCVFQGRLVRDCELKMTASGIEVVSFTVAVDRRPNKDTGEKTADFIDCVAYKQKASFVAKYFHKGSGILVTGELHQRNYVDKNNNKRVAWEVIANDIHFDGSKAAQVGAESSGSTDPVGTVSTAPAQTSFEEVGGEEDLPF